MSRILVPHDGGWYDRLKAVGYYSETELEGWIGQHLESLFPDHLVFPFKQAVPHKTTGVTKDPDMAMIRRDFSAWSIVEVELGGHPISHVVEQVETFAAGAYNPPTVARYVKQQLQKHCEKKVSLTRLTTFFAAHNPDVLVIVDEHSSAWEMELTKMGVNLCVFEIYKSVPGRNVFRTLGKYPVATVEGAHCRPAGIANTWEIIGNLTLKPRGKNKEISVVIDETMTKWAVIEDKGRRYLKFLGQYNPLAAKGEYALRRDKRNNYYLQKT